MSTPQATQQPSSSGAHVIVLRVALLFSLLYLFLVAIKLLESGIKLAGAGAAEGIFNGVSNPFAGLAAGILATVLVQSSSVTTSTIVALVGSGTVSLEAAVPMILGANVGTTITNTLVSLGSVARRTEFRRAFAAATAHDFFNLLAVAVFLPIEMATGFLAKTATLIADKLPVGEAGGKLDSPIKGAVKAGAGVVKDGFESLGAGGALLAILLLVAGLGLILISLTTITRVMRKVMAGRAEQALNAAVRKSGLLAVAAGALITISVQSSSITTSLLVPLCASGVLSLENAFPLMLGANIGTTITAFLASLATDLEGLKIALVHMIFNTLSVSMVLPFAAVRRIPINMARGLAIAAVRSKLYVIGYVVVTFIFIPLIGILLF